MCQQCYEKGLFDAFIQSQFKTKADAKNIAKKSGKEGVKNHNGQGPQRKWW